MNFYIPSVHSSCLLNVKPYSPPMQSIPQKDLTNISKAGPAIVIFRKTIRNQLPWLIFWWPSKSWVSEFPSKIFNFRFLMCSIRSQPNFQDPPQLNHDSQRALEKICHGNKLTQALDSFVLKCSVAVALCRSSITYVASQLC